MQDRSAEGPRPAAKTAEKPIDVRLAFKAKNELTARARAYRRDLGWNELRKANLAKWLRGPDGTKPGDKGGWLRQKDVVDGWKNDQATRDYLDNAKRRAVELAKRGVGEISTKLGIPSDQIAGKTLAEIYATAEAKGWNVKQGDVQGEEVRDYLYNAHEYAIEQQKAKEKKAQPAETVRPLEKGKPIEGNTIYAKKARILPDLHGGKELPTDATQAVARKKESPLADFLKDKTEGEIVVSVGDVFDRGGQSWESAQEMMKMVQNGEAVWNLGNHEALFMAAMAGDAAAFQTWMINGGSDMMVSAGVDISQGGNLLEAAKSNQNLQQLSKFLRANVKTYTIVDNVLVTHAGVLADPATGGLKNVSINGVDFGQGLDAMDRIQAEIRLGNENVIKWLANHGGTDQLNADNPFWVREKNFQDVVADPQKAHNLREALNGQANIRGTKIEFVVVGHTPSMGDQAKATQSLDLEGKPIQRFLFADTGYFESEEARVVKLRVADDTPEQVTITYEDPVEQKKILPEQRHNLDRKVGKESFEIVGKDESEAVHARTTTATENVALIAGVEIPEVTHEILNVIASGGNIPKKIQELGAAKIVTPAEDQTLTQEQMAQTALGYDLQIAGIQLEQQQIAEVYKKAQGKKKQLLEVRYETLKEQARQLTEKRSKLSVPNQVQEFVKACGVPEEAANQNPLGALSKTLEQTIANKDARKAFIEQLMGQITKGNLKEEDVKSFEKFLNSQAIQKFTKDKALFGAKAAGGVGLLMLLMAWLASKSGRGQAMG